MKKRKATAIWTGTGKDGKGTVSTQSGALKIASYTSNSRFGDGEGTNPEELLASAHASCFTMKLSYLASEEGFTPDKIETTAEVTIKDGTISTSHLTVRGNIKGMSSEAFQKIAEEARKNCPVSRVLK